jgi:SAM-dependent methyltransferase
MSSYAEFAPFYDAINGEPFERIRQILGFIESYNPEAQSVLELGCGTGAILAGLGSGFSLTGIDRSPEMLAYAKRRCPEATLVEADMTLLELGACFDVVICVFDTLNHVTNFDEWKKVFHGVRNHLNEGGIFIFDVNTIGRLSELGGMAPWVHDFEDNTLIMNVDFDAVALSSWNIRIFEKQDDGSYVLHQETIQELVVALDELRQALTTNFDLLEEMDLQGNRPTDASGRALFVWRRNSSAT